MFAITLADSDPGRTRCVLGIRHLSSRRPSPPPAVVGIGCRITTGVRVILCVRTMVALKSVADWFPESRLFLARWGHFPHDHMMRLCPVVVFTSFLQGSLTPKTPHNLDPPVAGCLRNSITSKNSASTNPTTQLRRRETDAERERKEDPYFREQKNQFGREGVSEREKKKNFKKSPSPKKQRKLRPSRGAENPAFLGLLYFKWTLFSLAGPSSELNSHNFAALLNSLRGSTCYSSTRQQEQRDNTDNNHG